MINSFSKKKNSRNKIDVYSHLKNAIQFLELKPGVSINETELANGLGVSRTPIREALIRLADEGLIEIYPQRGTYVSKIDLALCKEMAYMRHVLETEICLDLCKKKVKVSDFVEEKLALMQLAVKKGDCKSYIMRDDDFHRAIFACSNHEMIWNVLANTRAHYIRILMLDMMLPDSLDDSFKEHLIIINSIETGNAKELKKILNIHHDHQKMKRESQIREKYFEYFI